MIGKLKMVLSVFALLPLMGNASVLGEARYWMRAPYDRNGDGYLAGSSDHELPETMHAGANSTLNNGYSRGFTAGNGAANRIVRTDVLNPYLGIVEKDKPCLDLTANPVEVDGQMKYRPAEVVLSSGLSNFTFRYDNSYSFYLRYYWNGFFWTGASKSNWNMLLKLGLDQVGGGGGSGFGFGPKDHPQRLWLNFGGYAGQLHVDEHGSNKWIQVVGVLNGSTKKLTLYMSTRRGVLNTYNYDYPAKTETVGKDYGSYVWLGNMTENSNPKTGDNVQHFNGKVSDVAIWDRALTRDEALEVVSRPDAYAWKIGEPDGTSNEFAGLDATQATSNNGSWAALPNSVASGSGAFKVAFPFDPCWPISSSNAARSVAIAVRMAADSGTGVFAPTINGHALPSVAYAPERLALLIAPAEYMQNDNVLELAVTSGTAAKIDCISGGMSWNIGFKNDTRSLDGFGEPGVEDHLLGSSYFSKFAANLTGTNNEYPDKWASFLLNLPEELEGRLRFDVKVRMKSNHTADGYFAYNALEVNNENAGIFKVRMAWEDNTINIPSSLLHSGINRFVLRRYSTDFNDTGWDPIDCLTVTPMLEKSALTLLIR